MTLPEGQIYAEIRFEEETEQTSVGELAALLSQFENLYRRFEDNREDVSDAIPTEIDYSIFRDSDAQDMFIGRLYRSKVLDGIGYNRNINLVSQNYTSSENKGLKIELLQKQSPLLIGLTGGGALIAVLWIIAGIDYEREAVFRIDEEGNGYREVRSELKFSATSTSDLVEAIRRFFE